MTTRVDPSRMANAIRALSMDAVEKAKSGHPGLPMGAASKVAVPLRGDPERCAIQCADLPFWFWVADGADGTRRVVTSFAGSDIPQGPLRTATGDPGEWVHRITELAPDLAPSGPAVMKVWADDPLARGAYSAWDAASLGRRHAFERMHGAIAFDHVRFHYPSRPDLPALEDFNLEVRPGETVALVGPSGAGKSTVFAMLLRFHDPQSGSVRVDGVDVREVDPSALRASVALVPQQPALFASSVSSGTFRSNVSIQSPAMDCPPNPSAMLMRGSIRVMNPAARKPSVMPAPRAPMTCPTRASLKPACCCSSGGSSTIGVKFSMP